MTDKYVAVLGAAGFAAVVAGKPDAAMACGGFFCNQVPVDQSGEQVVFSIDDQHVTAVVQISYQGDAKDFAWVVPVATKPVIGVGTQSLFTQLQGRTQPSFSIQWDPSSNGCFYRAYAAGGAADGSASFDAGAGSHGVTVLDQREVGPYQTVTLESKSAEELIKWLDDNGYDQPESSTPYITHYVNKGMLFVALKLKQSAGVGDIQPLVLDMDGDPEACVPLILTRVAAIPDMPVLVYVLGQHRAVPTNWFSVEVNQRKINWMTGGSNYRQVVNQALDEAAGHGFVTEFAGPTSILKGTVYAEGRFNLAGLRGVTDPVQLLQRLAVSGLPRDATMLALLQKYLPMPQAVRDRGVSERDFYNNIGAYQKDLAGFQVDIDAFLADLDERTIKPLRAAQAMIDAKPYLTRLFSTVSPEEMTRDPLFDINADLPDVSNVHVARGSASCASDGAMKSVTLTLKNGDVIKLDGTWRYYDTSMPWPFAQTEPAASAIELAGSTGRRTRYSATQARLADGYLNSEPPDAVRMRVLPPDPEASDSSTGWCNIASGTSGSASTACLLAAIALGLLHRRRRR